ncbi:MAG: hypothetical protein K6F35_00940 [Lachnospiraceae bacterium]|nr:hypothetical protein [Lachnospiraceae bacterium]
MTCPRCGAEVPNEIAPEYEPITMWGYFGYEMLFSIPCVGLIILIVFSFTAQNVNVRNFARSYFCFMIILGVIIAVLAVTAAVVAINAGIMDYFDYFSS